MADFYHPWEDPPADEPSTVGTYQPIPSGVIPQPRQEIPPPTGEPGCIEDLLNDVSNRVRSFVAAQLDDLTSKVAILTARLDSVQRVDCIQGEHDYLTAED